MGVCDGPTFDVGIELIKEKTTASVPFEINLSAIEALGRTTGQVPLSTFYNGGV